MTKLLHVTSIPSIELVSIYNEYVNIIGENKLDLEEWLNENYGMTTMISKSAKMQTQRNPWHTKVLSK